jgi:hypothetical protein
MTTKATEREIAGWLSEQINRILDQGGYPFSESTVEPQLTGGKRRFPDIVIWENRRADEPFAFIELKAPGKTENVVRIPEVANRLRVNYAITWDFNQAILYYYDTDLGKKKEYPTHVLSDLEEWLQVNKKIALRKNIISFLDDLRVLHDKGNLHKFSPDKYFFIKLLQESTDALFKHFIEHLRKKMHDKKYERELDAFWTQQGILNLAKKETIELAARQWAYGLLTRIIFYLAIRREFPDLPDIIKKSQRAKSINKMIFAAFEDARRYDWQAVFEPDNKIEKIGIPRSCDKCLKELLGRLGEYSFGDLKEDVIGEIFESLIPETEKRKLGQYFTREDLVDFIIGFVVKSPKGHYCDPTCGSGTFLNRLYSRIQWLSRYQKRHHEILTQLWGFDIAKFPAELATINLFRQNVENFRSFPHIHVCDIFDVFPGQVFSFPPPKAGKGDFSKVDVELPEFSGMVGNFPFIRQEQIEKKVKGNKLKITKSVAKDWFKEYPEIFEATLNSGRHERLRSLEDNKFRKEIEESVDGKSIELKLSGQADIYAYLYLHTSKFLESDGRMGFITSNSYLDVRYGYELKRFFLNKFKVIAVVASWAEPWFDFASVNTLFTILERCDEPEERNGNIVKFVKLKKPLKELIPYGDLQNEENQRWEHIDTLVKRIELSGRSVKNGGKEVDSIEDDNFRIRLVKQDFLYHELNEYGQFAKWGKYLRAQDLFFEIIQEKRESLVPLKEIADIRFGIKTGINDFFYLEEIKPELFGLKRGRKYTRKKGCIYVRNASGWMGEIEKKFLVKVIKSPKESVTIDIDPKKLKYRLFMCNMSKEELKKSGYRGAFEYIKWGEKQKTKEGKNWAQVSSVKDRKQWWSLGDKKPYDILMQMVNNDRFLVFLNSDRVYVDHNLFELKPQEGDLEIVAALLNSSFTALNREVISRINLGDGATKTEGVDWSNNVLIFDYAKFTKSQKNEVLKNFRKIRDRKIYPIDKEIKRKDRKALDAAIFKAVGLDPEIHIPPLYSGLVELVNERLALPKMRKKVSKKKFEFSYSEVKRQIEEEILANGLRVFPDSFLGDSKKTRFEDISTTGIRLRIGGHFFGRYEILDENGAKICDARSMEMARYIICAYKPSEYIISVPKSDIIITKTVTSYERYIREIYNKLLKRAFSATQDHDMTDRIASELLRENGYSGDFDLTKDD